ncbi:hypothetical protein CHH28_12915 [Bacterioplanes sanyensis]|uniref:RND efflux pump membrane fusion protein barrel-sandwich domain-containing protein n=1 Tax=Bacterioplanes sanyensis TaxID=1249553 RepID=A0A222FL81_9GAMM|nr:hypothetical protein [Bacterioplanes sanyensis]ASP39519.1 hypothetical protein CHH28_12915 [Bacterioplanes sanyensis]
MKSWFSSVRLRQILAASVAVFILLLVLDELENTDVSVAQVTPATQHRVASVVQPRAEPSMPTVTVLGSVESCKWVDLTSEVAGRVLQTSAEYQRGTLLAPEQWLLQLDPLPYQAAVAEAKVALMNASMALKNARAQYAHDSLMVQTAQAQLEHYQLLAKQAQQNLSHTRITLPFAGELIEIKAHVGEHIAVGQSIATVLPHQGQDIRIAISEREFHLLPPSVEQQTVIIRDLNNDVLGHARIRGVSQYSAQLQRQLYLTPSKNLTLISGQPVRVQLPLAPWPSIFSLPESSLTAQHEIWWLDGQHRAQRHALHEFVLQDGRVFFHWPDAVANLSSIIAYPSDALAQGMYIKPHYIAASTADATTAIHANKASHAKTSTHLADSTATEGSL